jgi:hypothetical protein
MPSPQIPRTMSTSSRLLSTCSGKALPSEYHLVQK